MKTLIVLDSTHQVPFRRAKRAILEVADHIGLFFEVLDIAWLRLTERDLRPYALVILGQEGIAKSLSHEEFSVLFRRMTQGMGLVLLDGYLPGYPASFLSGLNATGWQDERTAAVRILPSHWISQRTAAQTVDLLQPLACHSYRRMPGWNPFLVSETSASVAAAAQFGRGKVVLFGLPAAVWQDDYLGHGAGLDGILWKSLVWAAHKPFPIKAMPPYVTARVNAACGSARASDICRRFSYLDTLARFQFVPAVGLYVKQCVADDMEVVRRAYYGGRAEFSAQAFACPAGGQPEPIYLRQDGSEFSDEEIADHFAYLDRTFASWDIRQARTLNALRGEVGRACLPFLRERGQTFLMNSTPLGRRSVDALPPGWELKPYGKPWFVLDAAMEARDFFVCVSQPPIALPRGMSDDFLAGCTSCDREFSSPDIPAAITQGTTQILSGLENLVFGCLSTSEERISRLRPAEWEEVVRGISLQIAGVPHLFRSYDQISACAANRMRFEIASAEEKDGLTILLKGESRQPAYLTLFLDETAGTVRQTFLEVPPFEKTVVLNFRL